MICAVHALLGAALGKLIGRPLPAFWAGLLSHLPADLVPHRDLDAVSEPLLVLAVLGLVARRQGWCSSPFWGALGASLPDLEHALWGVGQQAHRRKLFSTHRGLHGEYRPSVVPQLAVAAVCVVLLAAPGRRPTGGTEAGE